MGCGNSKSGKEPTKKPEEVPPEKKAIEQLKLVFSSIDKNKDNTASKEELTAAVKKDECLVGFLKDGGFGDVDIPTLLTTLDSNQDGKVTWEEFEKNLHEAAVKAQETGGVAAADAPAKERARTQLRLIFDSMEKNDDDTVSKDKVEEAIVKDEKLKALLPDVGLADADIPARVAAMITIMEDRMTWTEFESFLEEKAVMEVKAFGEVGAADQAADEKALVQLKKVFDTLDKNQAGAVDKQELKGGLGKDADLGKLIKEAGFNPQFDEFEYLDTNHAGTITWQEFEQHLKAAA